MRTREAAHAHRTVWSMPELGIPQTTIGHVVLSFRSISRDDEICGPPADEHVLHRSQRESARSGDRIQKPHRGVTDRGNDEVPIAHEHHPSVPLEDKLLASLEGNVALGDRSERLVLKLRHAIEK